MTATFLKKHHKRRARRNVGPFLIPVLELKQSVDERLALFVHIE